MKIHNKYGNIKFTYIVDVYQEVMYMNINDCAVILAGGEGTRMKSAKPKVMAEILFQPMISHVINAARGAGITDICVVTGYKSEILEAYLQGKTETVHQAERLGTGHAVMQAADFIKRHSGGNVLILAGDAPFIDSETIRNAYNAHASGGFSQTVISACVDNPFGYGRIVRGADGSFLAIVEQASADGETQKINEINSGAMWFTADELTDVLGKITNNNSKGEYYLTDSVDIGLKAGKKVGAFAASNADAVLGANTRVQLAELSETARRNKLNELMLSGVDIPCSDGVMIALDAQIGADTKILPGTIIKPGVKIGSDCVIGPNTVLEQCEIGEGSRVNASQCEFCKIGNNANLGPFMHVRPDSVIGDSVHCGNFTEIKNSVIGEGTSVSHLTYVGDSDVGSGVNFGCGCVTVNFNGKTKHRTVIGDGAFIGCNTNLVAPVKVGDYAFTAAGSTITEDVPAKALSVARARQINKEEWVLKNQPYRKEVK